MKLCIDGKGNLRIERAGELKSQWCVRNKEVQCGDHCPAFREPKGGDSTRFVSIQLCREAGMITEYAKDFADLRQNKGETK